MAAEVMPEMSFRRMKPGDPRKWQQEVRAALLELLRIKPQPGRWPRCIPQEPEDMGDYTRQKLLLEAHDGIGIPCYLLVPKKLSGPAPGLIALHGHGPGKVIPAGIAVDESARKLIVEGERDYAVQAVKRGYIAIAPDQRGFGETIIAQDLKNKHGNSCVQVSARLMQLGKTVLGERALDTMTCVDYLISRGDVDPGRIVATGNSGGGTATVFGTAVDERFAAAVPSCYFCTFRDSIMAMSHCICNFTPGLMAKMEMYDICGLFAPRPMLVIAGKDDSIFPLAGVKEAFERLAEIYEAFGARENLELYVGDGGHRYYAARVWPFLEEKLTIRGGKAAEKKVIHMRPHHFIDILRQIGAGQEFKPSPYGHAVHSVAKTLMQNPSTVMMLVNRCDAICAPCIHNKNGVCDDTLSDGKTSKHEFNTALDARLFAQLHLEEAMALSAADFCGILRERLGHPSGVWTSVPGDEAQKRLAMMLKGMEKFLGR
jgi:dienelactone hydrolase